MAFAHRPKMPESTETPSHDNIQVSRHCEDEDCDQRCGNAWFCASCGYTFCEDCWDLQRAHKSNRPKPGKAPHEKTSPEVAERVHNVLWPPQDDYMKVTLYRQEENAAWFGVDRTEKAVPSFQDYGRFLDLMNRTNSASTATSQPARDCRTPSLVSFVGETGAGKSTLVKLLIDLSGSNSGIFSTPVIGPRDAFTPSSEDVHLYLDPRTAGSVGPTLYADCEGLNGGEQVPLASQYRTSIETPDDPTTEISAKALKAVFEHRLEWATDENKRGRQFTATTLYPRLLFTFSDVVVFVLKNPRVIESVFEKLISWAALAIETSANQAILPHAIIVLNASEPSSTDGFWEVPMSTAAIFGALAGTVHDKKAFKDWAAFWEKRGKEIHTLEELVLCYYSSVQIVRVPADGRPNLMSTQIDKLHSALTTASIAARCTRNNLKMLLDVDDLQGYLMEAFRHYSTTLKMAFDFVQTAYRNLTIPRTFAGNITKLLLNIMDIQGSSGKLKFEPKTMFNDIGYLVASSIMLDTLRRNAKGLAKDLFPKYVDDLNQAMTAFYEQCWPCEYFQCVNVRNLHAKGHQNKKGRVLQVGSHICSFTLEQVQEMFTTKVYFCLEDLMARLDAMNSQADAITRMHLGARIHKEEVLGNFIRRLEHTTISQGGRSPTHLSLHSQTGCFCCLFGMAEHPLPCGHAICTECVRAYGQQSGDDINMHDCPFGNPGEEWTIPKPIRFNPPCAGVRVMSLDGGGIRGIVELEVLRHIELGLGGKLRIQSFFDLIVGTSTGGLIALGLGEMDWSVEKCMANFEKLCGKAFTPRLLANVPIIGKMINHYNHSKYLTAPLEEAFIEAYSADRYLFGGPKPAEDCKHRVRVAVTTATPAGGRAIVLANYNRPQNDKYQFQRPERLTEELKIWEAARATSAAPRLFRPLYHKSSEKTYVDGAVFHNNPVRIVDAERRFLWPDIDRPDILLSVGTAKPSEIHRDGNNHHAKQPASRGALAYFKSIVNLLQVSLEATLDCESTWDDYYSSASLGMGVCIAEQKLFRVNPEIHSVPNLDEKDKLHEIRQQAKQVLSADSTSIDQICRRLIASTFYFSPIRQNKPASKNGKYLVKGQILCRFPALSSDLRELGKHLLHRHTTGGTPLSFVTNSDLDSSSNFRSLKEIPLPASLFTEMINGNFYPQPLEFYVQGKSTQIDISVQFGRDDLCSISGFPRPLSSLMDALASNQRPPSPRGGARRTHTGWTSLSSSRPGTPSPRSSAEHVTTVWKPPKKGEWDDLKPDWKRYTTPYSEQVIEDEKMEQIYAKDSEMVFLDRDKTVVEVLAEAGAVTDGTRDRTGLSSAPAETRRAFRALFQPVSVTPVPASVGDETRAACYVVDGDAFKVYELWTGVLSGSQK